MEPRAGAAEALRAASRIRLAAACLVLVGLAMVQDPGFLTPDTKFDLVEAPVDFLGRALHLWDSEGAFGQLQNQAYGYLWPMGPFFALGFLAQIPGWVIQRLWMGLVMSVALGGTTKVARALGVRSDLACLTAGFAFALSPRMLTTLGPISIEAWPSAVAPWVLLALVHGSRTGSPRRWAALAGLAVAMVGGVNAAATFAVVPLGALWLLTRTPGPRRRALMLWWPLFTLLGTLWWLVPLFVMGAYSPPFLDYIETTAVTTFPTTLFDVLRGTSNWVPYIDPSSRAGNDLVTTPYLVLNSGLLLMVGFAGLIDRRTPERGFLGLSVLAGVLLVSAGHAGAAEGLFAGDVRTLLDGALAPLRNVHKFDVVVRLPLVLGLAFVLDRMVHRRRAERSGAGTDRLAGEVLTRGNQLVVLAMVLFAVAGSVVPALTGRITPGGATLEVPAYWRAAASWLADNGEGGSTALVVPGAPFADYLWGSPRDEPLQYFADSAWAVRNVIPLTPPANIRMLDEVERRLAQGDGSAGLAAYLRRAGVHYVVVRNDLDTSVDAPVPAVVHQALNRSGLLRVASFGPDVGGDATLVATRNNRAVVNGGWQARYPAVEVFEVPGTGTERAVTAQITPVVVGGPEDLDDLTDLDLLGDAPVQLATDVAGDAAPEGPVILTDGLQARERFFARIHDGYSAALAAGDPRRTSNPARDYLIDRDDRWSTMARFVGARGVAASSSQSDAATEGGSEQGQLPYAAVDRSDATAWVSGVNETDQAWWRVDLDAPVEVGTVTLTGGETAPDNQLLRVVTQQGGSDPVKVGPGQEVRVAVSPGRTDWLRVEDASGTPGRQITLADVSLPGLRVTRQLVTPTLPAGWPDPLAVVLRADRDARQGCVEVDDAVRCVEGRERDAEEATGMSRVVSLPAADSWAPELRVVPRAGPTLDRLIQRGQLVRVRTTSSAVPDPRGGPVAAIDGDPGTTWTAAVDDVRPTVTLSWIGAQTITGIDLEVEEGTAARTPDEVTLTWDGGTRDVDLTNGRATIKAITTERLELRVEGSEAVTDLGFDALAHPVGIGISELRLTGLSYLPLHVPNLAGVTACGTGPRLTVNQQSYDTFVEASAMELLSGSSVPAFICDAGSPTPRKQPLTSLALAAGDNTLDLESTRGFGAGSLVLRRDGVEVAVEEPTVASESGTAEQRSIVPQAGSHVLELRQNESAGWIAEQDGDVLAPVVLDGWKQGWVLEGDETVRAHFAPDRTYRMGLAAGAIAFGLLIGVVLLGRRRSGRLSEEPPPLRGRLLTAWLCGPVLIGAAALTAGWLGVVAVLAVGLPVGLAIRRWPDEASWVLSAPCFIVAVAYGITPWGSASGWAGEASWSVYLMLVPLVGVMVGAVGPASAPSHRPFSRRAGRSTTR